MVAPYADCNCASVTLSAEIIMSRTDLVADAIMMLRNAVMAKKEAQDVPASKMLESICRILKDEAYIEDYKLIEDKKQGILRIYLKYINAKSAIKNIKRISKPGLRKYVGRGKIPFVLRGRGLAIISTSRGLITDKTARAEGVGGEVVAYVW